VRLVFGLSYPQGSPDCPSASPRLPCHRDDGEAEGKFNSSQMTALATYSASKGKFLLFFKSFRSSFNGFWCVP